MIGLNDYQKFKLIRPLPDGWPKDNMGIPYLKNDDFNDFNWKAITFTSLCNRNTMKNKGNAIILLFHYDYLLERIWNNPLKYVVDFGAFKAVTIPDFSAYRNMEQWIIEMNIRKSLWLGCLFQSYGLKVIPTITWANPNTYDICFDHYPKNSVVAISTIGVRGNEEWFLKGFNEMKRRLEPILIIVRGNKIEGMEGNFIFVSFESTFNKKKEVM